jgi:hypothetical protein
MNATFGLVIGNASFLKVSADLVTSIPSLAGIAGFSPCTLPRTE